MMFGYSNNATYIHSTGILNQSSKRHWKGEDFYFLIKMAALILLSVLLKVNVGKISRSMDVMLFGPPSKQCHEL